jgi:hypothetical protein
MNVQPQLIDDLPSHGHDLVQAVLGTALSLVLAAGLGGWLLLHQGGAGSAAPVGADGREHARTAASAGDGSASPVTSTVPRSRDAPPRGMSTVPTAPSTQTVYIVASQAHADTLASELERASAIRDSLGLPPLEDRIVVFISDEEETLFWHARNEEERARGDLGMPALRVVDLRGRGAEPE